MLHLQDSGFRNLAPVGTIVVERVKAHILISQKSGKTYTFKLCIECPLYHLVIGQRIQDLLRDLLAAGKINHCTGPPSTLYPKSRISKSGLSAYLYTPHFCRLTEEYVSISILMFLHYCLL